MQPESIGRWTFEDLTAHRIYPESSLAYWPCLVRSELPPKWKSAKRLTDAMSYHHDVEDQASKLEDFRTQRDLIPRCLMPLAPVTIADRWSPFPLTLELLGSPLDGGDHLVGTRRTPSVYAIYQMPLSVPIEDELESNPDAKHLRQLLTIAVQRTKEMGTRLLVVARPGWSSTYAREELIPESIKQLMTRFGYLKTSRGPQSQF